MAPELVIATAPSVAYPGGVIAVRATDWLGPARGTLSTETDALASTGEAVRDAQQITPAVSGTLDEGDYADADDTLIIDADDIGLRDGFDYFVWITYKVDGDWDDTNGVLLRKCNQRVLNMVCAIGMHGDQGFPDENNPDLITRLLGHADPYAITFSFVTIASGDVLHFRAFAHDGVTAEVLIDQIVFVPFFGDSLIMQDIDSNAVGSLTTAFVDGADGGDANGKFTFKYVDLWNHFVSNRNSSDYQRFADAADGEWHIQVTPSDNFPLASGGNPITAHGYSIHAVRHEPFSTVDTFDNRTTTTNSQNMGINEDGYGYRIGASAQALNPAAYVSGGVGIMRIRQGLGNIDIEFGDDSVGASGNENQGAQLNADDHFIFSGEVEWTAGALSSGRWRFYFRTGNLLWEARLDPVAGTWQLGHIVTSTWVAFGSVQDISSWFGVGAPLGFKIEVKRYILRMRIWDASGAEPSTWDEEFFKPVVVSGTLHNYDYSSVFARVQAAYGSLVPTNGFGIQSLSAVGNTLPYDVTLHNIAWERDMYGSSEAMTVYVEQPEGDVLGEQIVPYGCPYFVYWGGRVWTESGGGTQRLSFSSKLVNDSGAAELQRADSLTWTFLFLPGGIVPMNWRQGQRKATSHRVLVRGG